ncbi:methyl-accepting chemotaxis protein [Methanospirillum hungatei]|uniref:methyl-accepting chemotaxis protein n=1 Tax=Methanospirillum hungatei TaxID=2203 RepID=UPI0026F1DA06|nr:methyl-accepting chemotaxis protein [Methanospirillum hungatei]MCA1915194.1 methyl-accepting chemotaxis protein [Methanospirillum hungatei]
MTESKDRRIDPDILQTLLDQNPVAMAQFDTQFHFVYANQAFCDLSGIPFEKLIGTRISDLKILKLEGEGSKAAIEQKRRGKARIEVEFPSGFKILNGYTIPVLDAQKNVTSALGVYTDITAEEWEKLKTTQIIENNPIPFLLLKTDLTIEGTNTAFLKMTGYTTDQLLRMNLADFKILKLEGKSARDCIASKKEAISDTFIEFPSGKKHIRIYSIPLLDEKNEVNSVLITCVDLTPQRRLAEYQQTEVERLAQNLQNLAKGDLHFDLTTGQADEYTKEAHGQFATIQENLKSAGENLTGVTKEMDRLIQAITAGNLKVMGEADKFAGTYQEIINGLNRVIKTVDVQVSGAIVLSGEYAKGNFSVIPPNIKAEGDFLILKEALMDIGVQVSAVLKEIDREMEELTTRAEEANAGVKDVAEGSAMVAKNAAEVGSQSERGKQNIDQVLRAMMDLSANVEEVASSTESVSRVTHDTDELSKKGVDLAHNAENGMKGIMASSGEVERIITEIKGEMAQIGKIVNVITDIASQTNLLALNAAIEAARAGEAGRGFAVVASEVKALALESRRSAENIAEMITSLQKKSDEAAKAMDQAESAVSQGNEAVLETLNIFNQIVESVGQIARNMDDVSKTTEQQAASVEEITASAHEVNSLVGEIATEAISAASAAEQSSAGTSQIVTVVEDLNKIIIEVSRAIGKFQYR